MIASYLYVYVVSIMSFIVPSYVRLFHVIYPSSLEPEILETDCWVHTGAIYVDPPYLISRLLPHKIPI